MQELFLKNLITIIFIALSIYGYVKGFATGFLKKVLSIGSLIVTIIATRYLTPVVSEMVKDITNIESTLTAIIYDSIVKNNFYDQINIPWLGSALGTGSIQEVIKNGICTNIANAIINLICGVFVFIVVLIIIRILIKVLDVVNYIPVVGQLNKILGGIFGIFEVVVITWILFTILRALESLPQVKVLTDNIKDSFIVSIIYKNNIIFNFFANLFSAFGSTS